MNSIDKTRNIGFMAHIDAGKTTTTERVLYYTGVTYKMGEVHDGNAVMDWMDQEQERGITITSAAITCTWKDHKINIIDTPGHVDFTVEVERSLKVLDGGVIILCGVGGVEPQTEKVWHQSRKYDIPSLFYINKMDRKEAEYSEVLAEINDKLGANHLLLQLPIYVEEEFKGVINLIEEKAYLYDSDLLGEKFEVIDIPHESIEKVKESRLELIEKIAENDKEIMELYVEEKSITVEELKNAVRRIVAQNKAYPVLMGSSFKNKGVQNLMDAVIDYLPAPDYLKKIKGYSLKTNKAIERKILKEEKFLAFVFKTVIDKHAGQQVYFRTYTGQLKVGDSVFNTRTEKKIRINKLFRIKSNKLERIDEVSYGDIALTVGIPNLATGDTLCDIREKMKLDQIVFPEPVMSSTIEPRLSSDHDKLNEILDKLKLEDPTFKVKVNKETGQLIISGMGELHIEVIKERIKREFGVEAKLGKPRVSYRETVESEGVGEDFYKSDEGLTKKHYGHVIVKVEPVKSYNKDKVCFELKDKEIPEEYFDAIKEGLIDSLSVGGLVGFAMADVKVSVIGGSHQDEHASEFGYKISAINALKKACKNGGYALLEPMMKIEILCHDDYIGEVINDLNARNGKIKNMDKKNNLNVLDGIVPLSNMFGYATVIRTLTQGRANYSMEFFDYVKMENKKMQKTLKEELGIYSY